MQHVIEKLKSMIKEHYGFESELDLKPMAVVKSNTGHLYSPMDKCLSLPLFDPNSKNIIGYFKVNNISEDHERMNRLNDLVTATLQSYIDIISKHDITENLMNHLQNELNTDNKVIHLHKERHIRNIKSHPSPAHESKSQMTIDPIVNSEILIYSSETTETAKLALQIHESSGNQFFLHLHHMAVNFLNSISDLDLLESTTLLIPDLTLLSQTQKKTLETYLLMEKKQDLLIIATLPVALKNISDNKELEYLTRHFHYFHLLSNHEQKALNGMETMDQYAKAILGLSTDHTLQIKPDRIAVKSYNLVPCLKELFPTVH